MWFPMEAGGGTNISRQNRSMGQVAGFRLLWEGTGEAPVPEPLPEDTEGDCGPGVLPPSCSKDLSRCCL